MSDPIIRMATLYKHNSKSEHSLGIVIPIDITRNLNWKSGDKLLLKILETNQVIITRAGR